MDNSTIVIGTRVTKRFRALLEKYLDLDAHVTVADFVRDAMREKIKKDAPRLYNELFEEKDK